MINLKLRKLLIFAAAVAGLGATALQAASPDFDTELLSLQHEWAHANYQAKSKAERRDAFESTVEHAAALSARYPGEVDAIAWEGIVLSTYAGEVSAFSAMKYAKAAREKLLQAEAMDAEALNGGVYASLGALYSKVPGGFVGFGDDDLANEYFLKALAVDANNIDNNYFYGEHLLKVENYDGALAALNRALQAPATANRPVFDAGRRDEIRGLIETASAH